MSDDLTFPLPRPTRPDGAAGVTTFDHTAGATTFDRAAGATTFDRAAGATTLLAVEDSRVASEALRLLCRRCGARLRRADSLASAHRHLRVYRPSAILVDLGLPDGSGLDLIATLARAALRIPRIIATSGDPGLAQQALAAGADAFLPKPFDLRAFQATLRGATADTPSPASGTGAPQAALSAPLSEDETASEARPDLLALRDDLTAAERVLAAPTAPADIDYLAQFLSSVGRAAGDPALCNAAVRLARDRASGGATGPALSHIAGLVRERLAGARAF
ncbi:response regulator [Halodurantibacterium flavum]|uniref:Response regulator n=1 Tax=Halodurantibacterium flavum TaxID=1382802 RepID=A0ABW4S3B4_9RHOB